MLSVWVSLYYVILTARFKIVSVLLRLEVINTKILYVLRVYPKNTLKNALPWLSTPPSFSPLCWLYEEVPYTEYNSFCPKNIVNRLALQTTAVIEMCTFARGEYYFFTEYLLALKKTISCLQITKRVQCAYLYIPYYDRLKTVDVVVLACLYI